MARRKAAGAGRKREAKSKKKPAVAEVEVIEEQKGLGIDDGVVILTTILFLVAFVLTDFKLGSEYQQGLFFK